MARLPDLAHGREIAIWCATIVVIALVSLRAVIVVPRMFVREHHYPSAWTMRQVEYFEITRRYAGMVLIVAWLALVAAAPFLPQRHPFSQSNAVLFIALLVQSYAFLVMVNPQDWNKSPIAKLKFTYVLAGVVLWWMMFLGTTIYVMAALALPRVFEIAPAVPRAYA